MRNRSVIVDKFVNKLSMREKEKAQAKLAQQCMQVSAEFDHWKDPNQRNLLAIVITLRDGERYLLDICDVFLESQTCEAFKGVLKRSLASGAKYLNSIVSDSQSACKKAREILVEEETFSHVIQHRCLAHLLNRLGNHITKSESFLDIMSWASKITSIAKNSTLFIAKLRVKNKRRLPPTNEVR